MRLQWCFVASLFFASVNAIINVAKGTKFIAAHWMVSGIPVDYRRHIDIAQKADVDAFALNYGGWNLAQYRNVWLQSISDIYKAAEGTNLALFFSFDMQSVGKEDVVSLTKQYSRHPNALWYDHRHVVSTFGGASPGFSWKADFKDVLRASGTPIFFLPMFNQFNVPGTNQYPEADGLFRWPNPGGEGGMVAELAIDAGYANLRKITQSFWMAGVSPWFFAHYDVKNWANPEDDAIFMDKWERLVALSPDAIELVTWNDFGESSYLGPAEGQVSDQIWAHLPHDALLDLSTYYHRFYKTSLRPTFTGSALYYFYRPHSKNAVAKSDPLGYPNDSGPLKDQVYVISLCDKQGKIYVQSGARKTTHICPVGIYRFGTPFSEGVQQFSIESEGVIVATGKGSVDISNTIDKINLNIVAGKVGAVKYDGANSPIQSTPIQSPVQSPPVQSTPIQSPKCPVPPLGASARQDCRYGSESLCVANRCCWSPLERNSGAPWCYVMPESPSVTLTCPNPPRMASARRDCKATSRSACLVAGCCWAPLERNSGAPWCYIK